MRKINQKIIAKVLGSLLVLEVLFMLVPTAISIYNGEDDLKAFISTIAITLASATVLILCGRGASKNLVKREGFVIVATSWTLFSLFGMLPFLISGYIPSVTDAYFETMSGFTTTGASILTDIESLPKGLLFWRSMIQWLGGMGIVLFTLAVMPMLNSGSGLQLFNAEVTGIVHDKLRPRINETANRLWGVYIVLTAVLALLLWAGPMSLYDAVCHSFTALATGGYSTKQASIAHWDSAYVEYMVTLFMIIGGINFSLLYYAMLGDFKKLLKDEEVRWLLVIILLTTTAVVAGLYVSGQDYGTFEKTVRVALFQIASNISTTGFVTADYNVWGNFFCVVFFLIMVFGSMAGSTSGGAKLVRLMVLLKNTANEFYRQLHPKAIVPVKINKKIISYELVSKVLAFIFVYVLILVGSALLLSAMGLTFMEAFGNTMSCMSNVGPGFGRQASSFASIPDAGKWVLSFVMLVGRLELFTVLILFTPSFWKE